MSYNACLTVKMKIEIRDAKREDVEIVAWTVLTALDMEQDKTGKFVKSCSEGDSIYSWRNSIIAEVDGKSVGCLIAYEGSRDQELREMTWPKLWDDMDPDYLRSVGAETRKGEFYLDSMALLPESRGHNIGRMLMEYAIDKGRRLGCNCSTLLVDCNKPRLEAYYRAIGFEPYGEMLYFGHRYTRMKYGL